MTILTDALKVADNVTKSLKLQTTVTFCRYGGSAGDGTETYGSAVTLHAVLEFKQRSVKTAEGEMAVSSATMTIIDLPALQSATPAVANISKAGWVHTKDKVTLPNGVTQPILNVGGFVDGGNGDLIPTEVYLG